MKKMLLLLIAAFSFNVPASGLLAPEQDTYTFGERVIVNAKDDNIKVLTARVNSTGSYSTFNLLTDSSTPLAYQVPTGKKLVVFGIKVKTIGTEANGILRYGDADIGLQSTAAPTNFVIRTGDVSLEDIHITSKDWVTQGLFWVVPASKYATFKLTQNNGANLMLYGKLEDE